MLHRLLGRPAFATLIIEGQRICIKRLDSQAMLYAPRPEDGAAV
jgi:hypothetical protein